MSIEEQNDSEYVEELLESNLDVALGRGLMDIGERIYRRSKIFTTIPKKIVIADTFNIPSFPLSLVKIDKSHISEMKLLRRDYFNTYGARVDNYLPYHYVVEFINGNYEVYSTRPLNYKPLVNKYQDSIIIAVMGNSNQDIYTREIYSTIAGIINPLRLMPGWRIDKTEFLNLGSNFQQDQINKYLI